MKWRCGAGGVSSIFIPSAIRVTVSVPEAGCRPDSSAGLGGLGCSTLCASALICPCLSLAMAILMMAVSTASRRPTICETRCRRFDCHPRGRGTCRPCRACRSDSHMFQGHECARGRHGGNCVAGQMCGSSTLLIDDAAWLQDSTLRHWEEQVGTAPPLRAGGQGFESPRLHQLEPR